MFNQFKSLGNDKRATAFTHLDIVAQRDSTKQKQADVQKLPIYVDVASQIV
jgi:hypothetical protein